MSAFSRLLSIALVWFFFVPVPVFGNLGTAPLLNAPESSSHSFLRFVSKKNSTKNTQSSISLVRNLRFHKHPQYTRVVLDLKKAVTYTTKQKEDQITILLQNTILGSKSRKKLRNKAFPQSLTVTESQIQKVTLTLDMNSLAKYEILTLTKPHRLVLDLYPAPPKAKQMTAVPSKPDKSTATIPKQRSAKKVSKFSPLPPRKSPSGKSSQTPPPQVTKTAPPKAKTKREVVIVIDPGHGGKDPGALGRHGTREKDIVLTISKQVTEMIKARLGAKVFLTREKDIFVKLEDRAEFANSKKADLFVSIHVNSHRQSSVKGLELYHFGEASDPRALEVAARENGTPLEDDGPAWQFILADKLNDKKIEDSRELAWTTRNEMVKYLKKHYKVKDHGVKTAPFFVLRMTTMAGILAEIAFVSNPTEEKLLKSKTYQKRVAEGIFQGIKAYAHPLQTVSR